MPIVSRRELRQRLGQYLLRDTHVGTNTASLGGGAASAFFIDTTLANAAFSGESQYARAWARHNGQTYRCASFNFPSGAFVTQQVTVSGVLSGSEWELHEKLSPEDKHLAIDWAVSRVWRRQEIHLSTVDGLTDYSVGYAFGQVFDIWVNTEPTATSGPGKAYIPRGIIDVRETASGRFLRLGRSFSSDQQIVIDAEVRATLGSADSATINIPNENMVLYAAESQCWEMLAKTGPATDRRMFLTNAQRAAAAYSRLAQRFAPQRDSAPRFRNSVV